MKGFNLDELLKFNKGSYINRSMLGSIKEESKLELLRNILPFWDKMEDKEYGGFYGSCTDEGTIIKYSNKGCVYLARILWSYSSLFLKFQNQDFYLKAENACNELINKFYDVKNKGFYWSINYDASVVDKTKHLYAQAFVMYGLSQFYKIKKDSKIRSILSDQLNIIYDCLYWFPKHYGEEYTVNWERKDNKIMEYNGFIPKITTNTLLHLAEGLANLYESTNDIKAKRLVKKIIKIIFKYGYDDKKYNIIQFLDYKLKSEVDVISYGHNLEVSWLFVEIFRQCNIKSQKQINRFINIGINNYKEALNNNYFYNQEINGVKDKSIIWWVQAEGMICLKNLYSLTGSEEYLRLLPKVFNFVKTNLRAPSNEWLWGLDENFNVLEDHPCAELWKSNYHTIRCLLKLMED